MALKVLTGPFLRDRTTLRLGGKALAEVVAERVEDLAQLPETLAGLGAEPFALGRGSNILARDGELPVVLVTAKFRDEIRARDADGDRLLVVAGAGIGLPRLLGFLGSQGLTGLEGLAGIPGSLGGAVAMNAGSFGASIGDCLSRVRVFFPDKGLEWLAPGDFQTGYRRFRMAGHNGFFLIVEVELDMTRDDPSRVMERARANYQRKKTTQPMQAHSAGCVFKNPSPDLPAGRLLEQVGLKGFSQGGMAFSEVHANFLVNKGGGVSDEAFGLIDLAREKVAKAFGVDLELEVRICPCN